MSVEVLQELRIYDSYHSMMSAMVQLRRLGYSSVVSTRENDIHYAIKITRRRHRVVAMLLRKLSHLERHQRVRIANRMEEVLNRIGRAS